jgi:hypothetical protein
VTFRCPFCGQKQTWGPFRDEGVHAYTSDGEEIDAGQRTNVNADGTQHHCKAGESFKLCEEEGRPWGRMIDDGGDE